MSEISRRLFVSGVLATAAIPAVSDDLGSLKSQVSSLRLDTAEERRKKALLEWAVEDIAAAQAAGLMDDAASLIADVQFALDKPLGKASPVDKGLFPLITTKRDNPWLDKTRERIAALVAKAQKFPRGNDSTKKDLGISYGYPYIQLGQEGSLLAQGFGNPETEYFGDPSLIAAIMRRFTACFEVLHPGAKLLADFGSSPHISEMYCLLNSSFPDLILPSRRVAWERALTLNCESILKLSLIHI